MWLLIMSLYCCLNNRVTIFKKYIYQLYTHTTILEPIDESTSGKSKWCICIAIYMWICDWFNQYIYFNRVFPFNCFHNFMYWRENRELAKQKNFKGDQSLIELLNLKNSTFKFWHSLIYIHALMKSKCMVEPNISICIHRISSHFNCMF